MKTRLISLMGLCITALSSLARALEVVETDRTSPVFYLTPVEIVLIVIFFILLVLAILKNRQLYVLFGKRKKYKHIRRATIKAEPIMEELKPRRHRFVLRDRIKNLVPKVTPKPRKTEYVDLDKSFRFNPKMSNDDQALWVEFRGENYIPNEKDWKKTTMWTNSKKEVKKAEVDKGIFEKSDFFQSNYDLFEEPEVEMETTYREVKEKVVKPKAVKKKSKEIKVHKSYKAKKPIHKKVVEESLNHRKRRGVLKTIAEVHHDEGCYQTN